MALRTPAEYRESLRDGRSVYLMGQRVDDVTEDPILKVVVDTVAEDFALAESEDAAVRDLYAVHDEEIGEPISRFFKTPATSEDLEKRSEMIAQSIRITGGLPFGKDIRTDCLNAIRNVATMMPDKPYGERAEAYLRHIRQTDPAMCGAVTDPKGDRSKPPSQQRHPDYYLRVVDRRPDGIVVNGCKLHITNAAVGTSSACERKPPRNGHRR